MSGALGSRAQGNREPVQPGVPSEHSSGAETPRVNPVSLPRPRGRTRSTSLLRTSRSSPVLCVGPLEQLGLTPCLVLRKTPRPTRGDRPDDLFLALAIAAWQAERSPGRSSSCGCPRTRAKTQRAARCGEGRKDPRRLGEVRAKNGHLAPEPADALKTRPENNAQGPLREIGACVA